VVWEVEASNRLHLPDYDNDIACWAEVRSRGLLRRVRLLSDLAEALQNGLNEERRRR